MEIINITHTHVILYITFYEQETEAVQFWNFCHILFSHNIPGRHKTWEENKANSWKVTALPLAVNIRNTTPYFTIIAAFYGATSTKVNNIFRELRCRNKTELKERYFLIAVQIKCNKRRGIVIVINDKAYVLAFGWTLFMQNERNTYVKLFVLLNNVYCLRFLRCIISILST